MLFVLIVTIFNFITFISLFGDYKRKEIEKDKETWERITGDKYK